MVDYKQVSDRAWMIDGWYTSDWNKHHPATVYEVMMYNWRVGRKGL